VIQAQLIGLKDRRGWKPAVALFQEWRRAGATQPLQPGMLIADTAGVPTVEFRGLCRAALELSLPPAIVIIEAEHPTQAFLDRWATLG